jgi:DNA-binding GntR family transcriptional regulator
LTGHGAAPRWLSIANQLSQQITTEQLRPGDRLPSTAQLCATRQVSTIVIRNVMIPLKAQGLIEGVPGVGTFVAGAGQNE